MTDYQKIKSFEKYQELLKMINKAYNEGKPETYDSILKDIEGTIETYRQTLVDYIQEEQKYVEFCNKLGELQQKVYNIYNEFNNLN